MPRIVHEVIAKTAKEFAATFYEEAAHSDAFYERHPKVTSFVGRNWRYFIGYARSALATMLAPDYPKPLDPGVRETIYEALCIDGTFKESPLILPETFH